MTEYQTKAEIVYTKILDKILKGEYKPGDKLVIRQISAELGVSDTPIREVFKRLESEHYVEYSANRSVTVRKMESSEIEEFFCIKGVLEGYATRISIDSLTSHDIEEIKTINEEMKEAIKNGSLSSISSLNKKFHMRIYANMHNRQLLEMIEDIWNKWSVTKRVFSTSPERALHSTEEHDEIIRLIEDKEYDKVELFVREHKIRAGREMVGSIMRNN